MSKGTFVVFSGGEGSGKTTILSMLKQEFPQLVPTRQPGGTPIGMQIRKILLDDPSLKPDGLTELYLFTADRAEHMATIISPALAQAETVISDRHWMDMYAYQWHATMGLAGRTEFMTRCVDPKWPKPDHWLWFDVDPSIGLARRRSTTEQNRIDERDLAFHQRVRDGFQLLYGWYPDHKVRIDANQSIEEVYASVKAALGTILQP